MRTAAIAAVVALVSSLGFWMLVGSSDEVRDTHSDDASVQLVSALSGRVARLENEAGHTPALVGTQTAPQGDFEKLRSAIADLKMRLATVEEGQKLKPSAETRPSEGKPIRDGVLERRHRLAIERDRTKIATLPAAQRPRRLYDLAMAERKAGWHESEESLLRSVIDEAGTESELGREAAYQIGWARSRRLDHAGAREAWLHSCTRYDPEHWRRAHARLNAASSAFKMQESGIARGELEDLVRDLEDRAKGEPKLESVLARAQALLARLN